MTLRQPVGNDAAPEREEELGHTEGEHHPAERAVLVGQIVGEVPPRDDLHLHTKEREDVAEPERAELLVFEHRLKGSAESGVGGHAQLSLSR